MVRSIAMEGISYGQDNSNRRYICHNYGQVNSNIGYVIWSVEQQ